MKLFRLRFIILGLLLCVFHVWCRTCGTDLVDPASSAYLSGAVVEGLVSQTFPPTPDGRFNMTIKVRKIFKGGPPIKKGRLLMIGEFGPENDEENCIYQSVQRGLTRYVFFLKETEHKYYSLSAFPLQFTKVIGRKIRKMLCKKGPCGKPPTLRKIKVRKFRAGKPILLRCRIRSSKPDALITWQKDGEDIRSKRVRIKSAKRSSRLKISKATAADAGTYTCRASNVLGSAEQVARVRVFRSKPKHEKKTTRRPTTEVVSHPPPFRLCGPEREGYCLNSGECRVILSMNIVKCHCKDTYRGARCDEIIHTFTDDNILDGRTGPQAHEKDRTVTIIGIVIGILIFVCICIASYFLAKRRREQFHRRQEEKKKRKNSKLDSQTYIPPSYRLLNSMDDVDGAEPKVKVQPPLTVHMETQTEETSFIPANPNTNMRLYVNPIDGISLQPNPGSQRNSRNRLSAVSADGVNPPQNRSSTGSGIQPPQTAVDVDQRSPRNPSVPQDTNPPGQMCKPKVMFDPPPPYKGCVPAIPVLRMESVGGASSEDDDPQNTDALIPLHISEGEDDRSPNSPTYGSTAFPHQKKIFSSYGKAASPRQQDEAKVDIPIYVNANGVGSRSSLTSSDSSTTGSADSEVSAVYKYPPHIPPHNPDTIDYPDSISWNERGSPEHVIADKDCPALPGNNKSKVTDVDKSYVPNKTPNKKLIQPRAGYIDFKQRLRNVVGSEPSVPT